MVSPYRQQPASNGATATIQEHLAVAQMQQVLATLSAQPALFEEAGFAGRADALDELELHVTDRLAGLLEAGDSAALRHLHQQAEALQARLEALDQQLFRWLRAAIRAGQYPPAALRALLAALVGPTGLPTGPGAGEATSYDSLDVLTNGLLGEVAPPQPTVALAPEMVYYQKTPARIIWELTANITPQDTFYDLGSGLGQVPLLVRLLSGATVRGVEIEPAYCRYAQACADALGLTSGVQFHCADARSLAYADGSIFFFFTPFTGHILTSVLAQLARVAQHKPLRIFSYGPGTQELARQPWLRRLGPPASSLYQLAEFAVQAA
ncbi:MAG: class I SAM-dependent methyltransferase [Janthinobacterium lividum]